MPSIKIPYPKTTTIFGEVSYPGLIVEVWLTRVGYQPFEFVLDPGADCTMLPRFMANLVGCQILDLNLPDTHVHGITGQGMPAYKGQIKIKIKSEEFEVRCLFTKSNRMPFLLGRVDFFSLFDVHFDIQNEQIVLTRLK